MTNECKEAWDDRQAVRPWVTRATLACLHKCLGEPFLRHLFVLVLVALVALSIGCALVALQLQTIDTIHAGVRLFPTYQTNLAPVVTLNQW